MPVPGRLEAQLPLSFANGKTKVVCGPYRGACYRFHETYSSSTAREDFGDPRNACGRDTGLGVFTHGTRR